MASWDRYLDDADRAVLARGQFGLRMGYGRRPAVVNIDVQNYMVGEQGGENGKYPSSCGQVGWAAAERIRLLSEAARAFGVPVFYTRFALDPSGKDMGVYQRKRKLLQTEYWCLEGTIGSEITPLAQPGPDDIVFVKKKPSAFFGTPLLSYLNDRGIDTVIVTGGATSNCVRATVFDAASYNYRVIVPADAVFDRIPISHQISLFDMDRQFADVTTSEKVLAYLKTLEGISYEA